MRARLSKVLIVFTLVGAIGGHWAILQSIAWFGMVVNFSQDSTVSEALIKTFNGKHPCCLCKVVQEGKKSEKRQSLLKLETKFDFWLVRSARLFYPPLMPHVLPREADSVNTRAESPPTPPPRLA